MAILMRTSDSGGLAEMDGMVRRKPTTICDSAPPKVRMVAACHPIGACGPHRPAGRCGRGALSHHILPEASGDDLRLDVLTCRLGRRRAVEDALTGLSAVMAAPAVIPAKKRKQKVTLRLDGQRLTLDWTTIT